MARPRIWTAEMDEEARRLADAGRTASEIAAALSEMVGRKISRDAVSGHATHRGIVLQRPQGGFSDLWTGPAGDILIEMCRDGAWPAKIRDAIKEQLGITVSVDAVRRYGYRKGLTFGEYIRPVAKPKPKAVKVPQPAKTPKVKAPSISPIDPPFLPPVQLVREYVPMGRKPVTFLASADFVCKQFLPGEPLGPTGLVCGNRVPKGRDYRFCAACGERLLVKAKEPKPSTFVILGKRRAAA